MEWDLQEIPSYPRSALLRPWHAWEERTMEQDLSRNQNSFCFFTKDKRFSKMGLLLINPQPVLSLCRVFANRVCEKGNTLALKSVFMAVAKHKNILT